MPPGEGYWLHTSGKYHAIFEHQNALSTAPNDYGLTAADVARKAGEQDSDWRERVLHKAMQKGWVRVRMSRGFVVFEYWKLTRKLADTIWEFTVDTLGAGPFTRMDLHEVPTRRSFSANAEQFFEAVDSHLGGARRPSRNAGEALYLAGLAIGQGR